MNYKKLSILFLLVLTIGSLSANFVAAAEPWDTLHDVVTLSFLSKLGVSATADPLEGIIRFLLLLLLFTVFYEGVKLAGLSKNTSVVIAGVFAFISAIFVPGTILLAAATGYGTIVSLVLVGIPIFLCLGGYFILKDHPWARVVVMLLLAYVVYLMGLSLEPTAGIAAFAPGFKGVIDNVHTAFVWIFWVVLAVALWSVFAALTSLGGATETRPNWFGNLKDRAFQWTRFTEKGKELRHAQREETRALSDIAIEKNEMEMLRAAEERGSKYQDFVKNIMRTHQIPSRTYLQTFDTDFDILIDAVAKVNDAEQKWKTSDRRAMTELNRLLAEMVNKSVSDRVMADLGAREKTIRDKFDLVASSIKRANKLFEDIGRDHHEIMKGAKKFYSKHGATTPLDMTGAAYLLGVLNDLVDKFRTELANARDEENEAMGFVAALAEKIKQNWVV